MPLRESASGDPLHLSTQAIGKGGLQTGALKGVRAIFVVPTAHTAAYWKGLRARSEAQLEMTSPRSEFHNPQGTMGNHTVFLVDFGAADSPSPATCGQDRLRRGRRHRLGAVELEERSRTRAERAKFDRPIEDEQDPSQPCERSSA